MMAQAEKSPRERLELAASVARLSDPQLREWIEKTAADEALGASLSLLLLEWADREPLAALEWASAHHKASFADILVACATEDPVGIGKAMKGKYRVGAEGVQDALRSLAKDDPLALGAFLEGLVPPSVAASAAVAELEYDLGIALGDPVLLKRVAEGIPTNARSGAPGNWTWHMIFNQVEKRYRETDPAGHAKWLQRYPESTAVIAKEPAPKHPAPMIHLPSE